MLGGVVLATALGARSPVVAGARRPDANRNRAELGGHSARRYKLRESNRAAFAALRTAFLVAILVDHA
jgi:hypothetical protein